MTPRFRVGLTADFMTEAAGLLDPILPAQFGALPQVAYEFMPAPQPAITPEQLRDYDGSNHCCHRSRPTRWPAPIGWP